MICWVSSVMYLLLSYLLIEFMYVMFMFTMILSKYAVIMPLTGVMYVIKIVSAVGCCIWKISALAIADDDDDACFSSTGWVTLTTCWLWLSTRLTHPSCYLSTNLASWGKFHDLSMPPSTLRPEIGMVYAVYQDVCEIKTRSCIRLSTLNYCTATSSI